MLQGNLYRLLRREVLAGVVLGCVLGVPAGAVAQAHRPLMEDEVVTPHRQRLYLKDGNYQIVMSYKILGDRVEYVSAERGGGKEEVPTALVDFEATRRWEHEHAAHAAGAKPEPVLDPELIKEEAERASRTPEVAAGLRLTPEDEVLMLDTFQGTPELVPLAQTTGDLNRNTAHNVLKAAINPLASSHQIVELKGNRAGVQVHVELPVLYVRLGEDAEASGDAFKVDTQGAAARVKENSALAAMKYVIVRVDVRRDVRVVASFNINMLGGVKRQEDVVETMTEILPGGHWMKVVPREALGFGEYALMEVLGPKEVNLNVWDFGVHPTAPENRDAIKPEERRPGGLERRRP